MVKKLFIYMFLLSTIEPFLKSFSQTHNNVCTSFNGYYFPDYNEDCYYDPDTTLDTAQMIEKYTKSLQTYDVTTEDGYILKMFRIFHKNPKGVILVHHSIATHSRIYLWQGNASFALNLWQNGFDVWLTNQRGTFESNRHINLTTRDYSYWDFSFHEMGLYDVSAELELIRQETNNSKVIFLGHSLGATIGLTYASMKPEEARNYLKTIVLLSPAAYLHYGTSLIYLFKPFVNYLMKFSQVIRLGSGFFFLPLIMPVARLLLRFFPFILFIVNIFIYLFCGYTPSETDPTFFNFDGSVYANDFSLKTLFHFAQLTQTENQFTMYDYGKHENLRKYGNSTPPPYPVQNISVPILLLSSLKDALVSSKDCEIFFQSLPQKAKVYEHWVVDGLNHLDLLLGLHRREIYTDKLMTFLNSL